MCRGLCGRKRRAERGWDCCAGALVRTERREMGSTADLRDS